MAEIEQRRRRALIAATIQEIGVQGSLDVTVGRIAKRAGVSSGLAHHYFGSKDEIFLAAMRHIMGGFGRNVLRGLGSARTPRARLAAVIEGAFAPDQFEPGVVAAWLAFYVRAQSSDAARRLLRVYHARLRSNLIAPLRALAGEEAERIAEGTAALIDGLYLRHALQAAPPDAAAAIAIVSDYIDSQAGAAESASLPGSTGQSGDGSDVACDSGSPGQAG